MMRLNKILAALTATTVIATGALAQDYGFFGLYGDGGILNNNFTIHVSDLPGLTNGEEVRDLRIRMQVGPDIPGSPANSGGNFSVRIDLRYLDIEFKNTVTGVPALLSGRMATSSNTTTIVNLGLFAFRGTTETGASLVGAAAMGGRWIDVGRVVEFKAAFLSTTFGDFNDSHADPFLRTGSSSQGRPLPKMIIKWGNIYSDFGLNNPTTAPISNMSGSASSFIWAPNENFDNNRSYFVPVLGNTFTVVPEPASMIALGTGLAGLLAVRRRRK